MNPKIGIVVVTFNRLSLLKEEIESLRAQTYPDFKIIVVDNGSTDGTGKWLSEQSDIHTITQENLGGAGGFYTGMKYVAENPEFDYCWIMDDDVFCYPDSLQKLVDGFQIVPEAGFICSRVVGEDGVSIMNSPNIDLKPSVTGYPDWLRYSENGLIKVQSATFVSVLLPVRSIKELGLPYKEFFIWCDDIEYTLRISEKYKCFVSCFSTVLHKRKIQQALSFFTETNETRLNFYFYSYRNMLFLNKKHESLKHRVKSIFILIFSVLFKSFFLFDFKRFSIVFKALLNSFSFNPKIDYPNIN